LRLFGWVPTFQLMIREIIAGQNRQLLCWRRKQQNCSYNVKTAEKLKLFQTHKQKHCFSFYAIFIRQLRCIRPFLDSKTASLIATSIVHSKLRLL